MTDWRNDLAAETEMMPTGFIGRRNIIEFVRTVMYPSCVLRGVKRRSQKLHYCLSDR